MTQKAAAMRKFSHRNSFLFFILVKVPGGFDSCIVCQSSEPDPWIRVILR